MGKKYNLCGGDQGLAALLDKYAMCLDTLEAKQVDLINSMELADALQIANALHQRLQFQAKAQQGGGGWRIDPFAPDNDLEAACNLLAQSDANHAAKAFCDKVKSRCNAEGVCADISVLPRELEARRLAPALNRIYGIQGDTTVSAAKRLHHGGMGAVSCGMLTLLLSAAKMA